MKFKFTILALVSLLLLSIFASSCGKKSPAGPATDQTPATATPTFTRQVNSATITQTVTETGTMAATSTITVIISGTSTPQDTQTNTPIALDTAEETATITATTADTAASTAVSTATDTEIATEISTPMDTETDTQVPTATATETATGIPTPADTETNTSVPTATATETSAEISSPTATATNSPVASHMVSFDPNGGLGTMPGQSINEGDSANLNTNTFTNAGYDFAGWALSAGGGIAYNDRQNFIMGSSDVKLYAVWVASGSLEIELNFDAQNCNDSSGSGINGTGVNISYASDGNGGYAASLDGSTSYISLPLDTIRSQPEFTIMMRFKANPGQYGALFGYQNSPVGSTPSDFIPMITVRSDGILYGSLWVGTDLTVLSSTAVNDGAWHTVYFSVKTNSIALYLDGAQIGINTGTIEHLDMSYNQMGAADSAGRTLQPDADGNNNYWYYYNGLIDDFKFYTKAMH